MWTHRFVALGTLTFLAVAPLARGNGLTMVACAPGYPGSTVEAQPAMDGLAAAVTAAAGWEAGAVEAAYYEIEDDGVAAIGPKDVGVALVTLPFFLEHREELDLRPELMAVPAGRDPLERWSLVAGAGRVARPTDLDGWELLSLAGHSHRFVRGPALAAWGELPESLTITFSGAVLSGLRRAAKGEHVALLLDGDQTESIARLPFADQLEIVYRSQLLPASVVCSVGDHAAPEKLSVVLAALEDLENRPSAAEALAGVRLAGFVAVDKASLDQAQRLFSGSRE